MSENLELTTREPLPVARQEPTPAEMMQEMVRQGLTKDNAEAFATLCKLNEHMEDRKIQRESQAAFNRSFVAVQKLMPTIRADRAVTKDGQTLYTYCSYEEIWAQVQPILSENGFSVRYSQEEKDGRMTTTCYLMHEAGITTSNGYTVRSGKGAPGMNETKCDAAASTVAQREALCDALNILRRSRDSDARHEGGTITKEQADALRNRVRATASKEDSFLKFAGGAKSFETIPAVMLPLLDHFLKSREKTA